METPAVRLELTFTDYDLRFAGEISPSLTLVMAVRGDLVEGRGKRLLHRRSWRYQSESRNFFDLAAAGGTLFRDEFEAGYRRLADRIVDDLFVSASVGTSDRGKPGTAWTVGAVDFQSLAAVKDGAPCGKGLRAFVLRIDDEPMEANIRQPGIATFPPGEHVLTVACGEYRAAPSADAKRCGEIAFRAEAGHDYALRWSLETDRLTLHDVRPDVKVAEGMTWRRERNLFTSLFASRRCRRPDPRETG